MYTSYYVMDRPTKNEMEVRVVQVNGLNRNDTISIMEGVKQRGDTYHHDYPKSKYAGKWIKRLDSLNELIELGGFIDLKCKLIDTLNTRPKGRDKHVDYMNPGEQLLDNPYLPR